MTYHVMSQSFVVVPFGSPPAFSPVVLCSSQTRRGAGCTRCRIWCSRSMHFDDCVPLIKSNASICNNNLGTGCVSEDFTTWAHLMHDFLGPTQVVMLHAEAFIANS